MKRLHKLGIPANDFVEPANIPSETKLGFLSKRILFIFTTLL